jgi:hypothetical protein
MILTDPNDLVTYEVLDFLQKKLDTVSVNLTNHPSKGGSPFLFGLTAFKPHELALESPDKKNEIKTVATDGSRFFWNPDFFTRLTVKEVKLALMHEMYHIILMHNYFNKPYNYYIMSVANDYEVNSIIWTDYSKYNSGKSPWGGNIGNPLSLNDYISYIDGKAELLKGSFIFADKTLYNRSKVSIYETILKHWKTSPRRCEICNNLSLEPKTKKPVKTFTPHKNLCVKCGSKIDDYRGHVRISLTDKEILSDIDRAIDIAEDISTDAVPIYFKCKFKLTKPKVRLIDGVNITCNLFIKKYGSNNNWKRPRRRLLSSGIYMPKRLGFKPTWLCLLDTSGSMSEFNIMHGISQLQSLSYKSVGYVVPGDSQVYWEQLTKISSIDDLSKINLVGRGRTNFNSFFKNFEGKTDESIDFLIIITDGFCPRVPIGLKPKQDVIWGITSSCEFVPSFGKVYSLK